MLDKLIAIIVFVIAFALIICIHEAGHLSMAKLFKVYCKEYSIGFGPAIYSKRRKGHETKFSIRCVPLGGYVSMFGEEEMAEDDPDFKDIPADRSLEGVKKWKKAIIVSAGVILNAILAFVLIFISNFAFPTIMPSNQVEIAEGSVAFEAGLRNEDILLFPTYGDNLIMTFQYEYEAELKKIHQGIFFVVDNDVCDNEGNQYVVGFYFDGNKKPTFSTGLKVFPAISREEVPTSEINNKLYSEWLSSDAETKYFADVTKDDFVFEKDTTLKGVTLSIRKDDETILPIDFDISVKATPKANSFVNSYEDLGISFITVKKNYTFKEKMNNTLVDYKNASLAVFKGLKILVTGGLSNMSGFVGILDQSTTFFTHYTMQTYLYFWGLISVNLAIFNLLPFPGLDGWQLLVTVIEGITRKQLPKKFKTIMSLIGLFLLLGLMVVILIVDVFRLIGF